MCTAFLIQHGLYTHVAADWATPLTPLEKVDQSPDRDGGFLPPKVGMEDEAFQRDEQKLSEGDDVAASWKLSKEREETTTDENL